jgi:hypothetical protein
MTTPLCKTFHSLAAATRRRIISADEVGLRWSEESNTEFLLLRLKIKHSSEVLIKAFNKREEGINGADWEWWFIGANANFGMRVQAKRIQLETQTFGYLRYRRKGHKRDQMTVLIQGAASDNLTPVYCFYVASRRRKWRRASGCLIGHAQQIQLVQSNRLRDLYPLLIPWDNLVCPSTGGGSTIAHHAAAALRRAIEQGAHSIGDLPTRQLTGVQREPPPYISQFLEDQSSPVLLEGRTLERGIKGIVVIREA